MRQARVILADSHPSMLGGIRRLLGDEVETVRMVTDEISLTHALEHFSPDAVVADDQVIGDGLIGAYSDCPWPPAQDDILTLQLGEFDGKIRDISGLCLIKIRKKGAKEMKVKSRVTMVLAILGIAMAMVVPGISQEKQADNMQIVNMQIVIEKIRADKKLLVAENMQLTEAEAKAFWPVYDRYQDELFLLRSRTAKLIKDYTDAYDKMSNDAAKKLLDEFMTIEALGPKLRQAYLPKFRKALPETKVVRYYQIENKIQAALFYELAANIPLMKAAQ